MSKEVFISQYLKLKELNGGRKPLRKEFVKHFNIPELQLQKAFGKDPYSKLQEASGDAPNKLQLERTPIKVILNQYGELVRTHKRIPVSSDWIEANYYPLTDGISKVHKLKWSEMPSAFVKTFSNNIKWKDVLEILNSNSEVASNSKSTKAFDEIVEKLESWKPDRKRMIEEGYKIELRNYLENFFRLEEEVGESNPDLLINGKYPIEVKKDPTLSEYDRLLGQMIRHNKLYGSAIAVVISISSEDRFKRFQKLFIEVHTKLGMTAEIISK
jgi:hypothetical protein